MQQAQIQKLRPSNVQFILSDSLDVRLAFDRLQKLWSKYGEKYLKWFNALSPEEALVDVMDDKLDYVTTTDAAGSWTSKHIPTPTGIAPDSLCLLPELHTRGPSFEGLPDEEVIY